MGRPRKKLSLVGTFLGPRVLTLSELSHRLNCSRTTVLRRLKEHGYYSSYNHRGKFMTIEEAARFDSHGLWLCNSNATRPEPKERQLLPNSLRGDRTKEDRRGLQLRCPKGRHGLAGKLAAGETVGFTSGQTGG